MADFGIDVSRWQGNFNFQKAKSEGVKFAIIKAGGSDSGRYRDGKFDVYYQQCKDLSIPVGCYYFGRDLTVDSAKQSANHFLELMKGKQFEYPVYYDVEGQMISKTNKTLLTNIVDTFCSTVEKAGYYVGIYSSQSFFNSNMDDSKLKKYTHWVAAWTKNKPTLRSGANIDVWQYGGETNVQRSNKVAGVTCDQDFSYVDFPYVIKNVGLNGFPKYINPENKVTYHTVQEGETITQIADKYGISVDELATKNKLINVGDKLIVS